LLFGTWIKTAGSAQWEYNLGPAHALSVAACFAGENLIWPPPLLRRWDGLVWTLEGWKRCTDLFGRMECGWIHLFLFVFTFLNTQIHPSYRITLHFFFENISRLFYQKIRYFDKIPFQQGTTNYIKNKNKNKNGSSLIAQYHRDSSLV
jgi:hypothetical protein